MIVGLIADTHGLVRTEALEALRGVDLILHAGDVGGSRVLTALGAVAPVLAVRGNVDDAMDGLAESVERELEGVRVHVSHGHEIGSPSPARLAARYAADVLVFGHTHKAVIEQVGLALVINPGAAGPARFKLTPSLAILELPALRARIVPLLPARV